MKRSLPNFLVIGAARSGTTSLHKYLSQHPEIYMSPVKEPDLFAFEGGKPGFRGPDDEDRRIIRINKYPFLRSKYVFSVTTLRDYRKLFARASSHKAVGESSVIYLYFPGAAERIKRTIPDVKLIALLRHPVDRAYSRFLLARRQGIEPIADFADSLKAEARRIRNNWSPIWFYKQRGFYHRQLKPFYDRFDRKQIKVILYENLRDDPFAALQGIFSFLGVRDTFIPDVSRRHNPSEGLYVEPRSWLFHNLILRPTRMKGLMKRMLAGDVYGRIKSFVYRCNTRKSGWMRYSPMPDEVRQQLMDEYRPDILKLQDLIGQDLSGWLK